MNAARERLERAAQAIHHRGARVIPHSDQLRDVECLASEEASRHEEWADGLTPSEYLLERVRRAQARKRGEQP